MGFIDKDNKVYAYIIDGDIRTLSNENNPEAIRREYETSDGKKGVKYELIKKGIKGRITNVFFKDSPYGENLYLIFDNDISLQLSVEQSYAQDVMCKLPNVDLMKEVTIDPYSFNDERGKLKRGITIYQTPDGVDENSAKLKVLSYFDDKENKTKLHGYPIPTGDVKTYGKSDWKIYFLNVRKFLMDYIKNNICTKFGEINTQQPNEDWKKDTYQTTAGEIKIEDIPFDTPKTEVDQNVAKLEEINKLAKEKLGVATDAEVAMAVMNKTGKAYIPINYDVIINELKSL